jgi:hypothetical protein
MAQEEKDQLRIIELQLVLDAEGRVKVPPQLLRQLGVGPGDLLTFSFDEQGRAAVTGRKKPPERKTSLE